MLSKEELAAFLTLLLAFANANQLSATKMGELFHISKPTAARWIKRARSADPTAGRSYIYIHLASPIMTKIETLNELNESRGIYLALDGYSAAKKVELLQHALAGRMV